MMNQVHEYSRPHVAGALRCVIAGLTITVAGACGGSGAMTPTMNRGGPPQVVTSATVNATPALAFTPPEVHLLQGGTVTFAFGGVAHNVYFDNDPAGAPDNIPGVNSNTNVIRTFGTPGSYAFNCHIHPGMHGTVVVVAPDTA